MIKTVKDLKEYLDSFPEDMLVFCFNHDNWDIETCEPNICEVIPHDNKNYRAQPYSIERVRKFNPATEIGDKYLLV